jgi:uncharacterized protein
MTYSAANLAFVATAFFLAGLVKGITGMGLPTVAMAVLGATFSPIVAASLLIVPSFVTNIWQLAAGPALPALARRLWPMMLAIVCGTLLSLPMLAGGKAGATTATLGAALTLYALYSLFAGPLRVPPGLERWLQAPVGLLTGLITGATGIFVIPAVPWLQSMGLKKDELVQALGLSFTLSTLALAAGLAAHGSFHVGDLSVSVMATFPALAGMATGQSCRRHVSSATFRRWFLSFLLLLGLEMLTRPF